MYVQRSRNKSRYGVMSAILYRYTFQQPAFIDGVMFLLTYAILHGLCAALHLQLVARQHRSLLVKRSETFLKWIKQPF